MSALPPLIERCTTIMTSLPTINLGSLFPAANFFFTLVGNFCQATVVFLRIVAGLAEVLASSIELVNDKYFRRDIVNSSSGYQTNAHENDSKRVAVENKKETTRNMNCKPIDVTNENGKCSTQKNKSEAKKARGRAKISKLRQERLIFGLPVASETDGVWD